MTYNINFQKILFIVKLRLVSNYSSINTKNGAIQQPIKSSMQSQYAALEYEGIVCFYSGENAGYKSRIVWFESCFSLETRINVFCC